MKLQYTEENTFSERLLINFTLLTILTSLGTFIVGHLLLLDKTSFVSSIGVEVVIVSLLLSIFAIAHTCRSLTWGVVVVFSLLSLSIYFGTHWLSWLIFPAGFYGLYIIASNLKGNPNTDRVALFKAILLGTLVIISAKIPVSFDMLDKLISGNVHRDTLYHASIAAMIKNYGVVSTGLNGLIETPYHILSHTLIIAISSITSAGILEAYGLIPLLLFIPLLITSVAYVAATVGNKKYFYHYYLLTGFFLAVSPRILKIWGLKESYFGSESYSVSLVLLVLSLPLLIKNKFTLTDYILTLIAIVLMTLAKASVGSIFLGLLAVRLLWFTSLNTALKELIFFTFSTALVFYILRPALYMRSFYDDLGYWEYVKHYSLLGENISGPAYIAVIPVASFIIMHFIFSWITIKSRLSTAGYRGILRDRVAIYSFAAVSGGLLIVMLPILPGGIAYYFSSVAMFVSLPWFIIIMADKRINWIKNPFVTALFVILILKSTKLLDKTLFKRDNIPDEEHIAFVQKLLKSREIAPTNTYLKPRDLAIAERSNPTQVCMAKPFVYPAVSEKAWVGIIDMNKGCDYQHYGYSQYFEDKGTNTRPLKAHVPENIKITTVDF